MPASDQARHVNLEISSDPDPIQGTIQHHDGTRERFWGWLDLMAALDRGTSADRNEGAA
jgi:hypothetical protein